MNLICSYIKNIKVLGVLLSILFSFFFVNGIIYVVDTKLGYFNLLHSTTLRNIESSYEEKNSEVYEEGSNVVVLLNNEIFEKEFNSISPLNKKKLSLLLEKILIQKPDKVIFDLDISPDYDFGQKEKQNENILYEKLIQYSKEVDILLPFIFIAQTQENKDTKIKWFKNMCKNNISFGMPFISNEIGSVLQYKNYKNHISLFDKENKNTICSEYKNEKDLLNLAIKNELSKYNESKNYPINYQKISNSTIEISSINELKNYNFKDKIVYIGGGYGYDDKYLTPHGEKYGVEVLNAITYSNSHKIDHAGIFINILFFDLIIGMSFGLIITLILKYRSINDLTLSKLFFCNIGLILIVIVYLIISMYFSAYAFHNFYIWMNPIPLLIGMFIDLIMGLGEKDIDIEKEDKYKFIVYGFRFAFICTGVYAFFV